MANPNYVYCGETSVPNRQIPTPTVGTTSFRGGEQQQNFVNGGQQTHHYQCDYFAGHPFPGAETMKLLSSCANDREVENGGGIHEAADIITKEVDMTRKNTKLTREQVETLERSFQEDIELEQQHAAGKTAEIRNKIKMKLEPEKKMKLSKELGLHPRQVSTWFQNRRAKLKGKQIEQLYHVLKQDYEILTRENQYIHQEVMELKGKLYNRPSMQYSIANVEHGPLLPAEYNAVPEGTRTSFAVQCQNDAEQGRTGNLNTNIIERNSYLCCDQADYYYSTASFPYWGISSEHP